VYCVHVFEKNLTDQSFLEWRGVLGIVPLSIAKATEYTYGIIIVIIRHKVNEMEVGAWI